MAKLISKTRWGIEKILSTFDDLDARKKMFISLKCCNLWRQKLVNIGQLLSHYREKVRLTRHNGAECILDLVTDCQWGSGSWMEPSAIYLELTCWQPDCYQYVQPSSLITTHETGDRQRTHTAEQLAKLLAVGSMGAVVGGGGTGEAPPPFEILGGVPQKSRLLKKIWVHNIFLDFTKIFEINWPKSEEKLEFGVGGFDVPESIPPVKTLWGAHGWFQ